MDEVNQLTDGIDEESNFFQYKPVLCIKKG